MVVVILYNDVISCDMDIRPALLGISTGTVIVLYPGFACIMGRKTMSVEH